MYPYLELFEPDQDDYREVEPWVPDLLLTNGDIIKGTDCAGEYFEYLVGARLNPLGRQMLKSVKTLSQIGLIEIHEGIGEWISIAPWDQRSV
jgi:hypothetical protein